MRIRRPLPPSAAILLTAALLLSGCSSGHRASAGPDTPPKSLASVGGRTGPSTILTHAPNLNDPSPTDPTTVVRISMLRSGQTITLPATIGYAIIGLRFNASAGYRLHVQVGGPGSYSLDLPISSPSGTVELPRDKMLPGKRDLTVSLTRTGVTSARLSRVVRLNDVTIYGPK